MGLLKSKWLLTLVALATCVCALAQEQARDLVVARSVTPPGLPVYTGSHALIIGINDYGKMPSVHLNFSVADARDFAKILVDSYGFKPAEVKVLTDGDATLANIRAALADLANPANVKPDDRILIYFSGHGQTVKDKAGVDHGFLIPSDGSVDLDNPKLEDYAKTCLPMQEVWDTLDPSPAKHIAVIADACFSGLLTKSRALDPNNYALNAYLTMPARQAISAGGKGQRTWEDQQYGHGVFTYSLLQELKRRAQNRQQVFTLVDLYASIQDSVVQLSKGRQVPQYSPFFTEGQMLFFPSTAPADDTKSDTGPTDNPKPPDVSKPPEIPLAKLTIGTNPDGATVTVDSEPLGTTPITKELPVADRKTVHVKVEMEGYETQERDVDLRPKKETKVNFKLKKAKPAPPVAKVARLAISSDPTGAAVFVDGVQVGTTPFTLERPLAQASTVTIRVTAEGYDPAEQQTTLDPEKDGAVALTLTKTPPKPPVKKLPLLLQPFGSQGLNSAASDLRLSPDGKLLAAVGADHTLTVYNIATGAIVKSVPEPTNGYVRITPDFKHLVFVSMLKDAHHSWATVLVQDFLNGSSGSIYSTDMAGCAQMSYAWTDGSTVLISGLTPDNNAGFAALDLKTGKSVAFNASGRLTAGVASADGRALASYHQSTKIGQAVSLVLMRGGDHMDQIQVPIDDSDLGVRLFMAPSGDVVAANNGLRIDQRHFRSTGFKVFDVQSGKLLFSSQTRTALGFIDGGSKLAAWSDGVLEVFDAKTGASLGTMETPSLALSSDGLFATSLDAGNRAIFYRVEAAR